MRAAISRAGRQRLLRAGLAALLVLLAVPAWPQEESPQPPEAPGTLPSPTQLDVGDVLQGVQDATQPDRISGTLLIVLLLTVLSLAPAILVMTTSFTRIIVVLGFLRQAMATQQSPPNQVLIGLALFLTFFVMAPTYERVYSDAIAPYVAEEIGFEDAWRAAQAPIRDFMLRQVRAKDLALFINMSGRAGQIEDYEDIPNSVLMPAFVLSELRIAFQIGFIIYIPFLIIDMVVASTLMAMGMMMLPPIFVSLPFKIIMFVLADGWYILVEELVAGFG